MSQTNDNIEDYLNKIEKFKQYSKDSNDITLYYILERYFQDHKNWRNLNLNVYGEKFSSNINKNYFEGYETFNKSDSLHEIQKRISEKTGFPIETFVGFGNYYGQEYGPDNKKWTIFTDYIVDANTQIENSLYNSSKVENRYVYLYIDPCKSKIFECINENQIKNDKKQQILEDNIFKLEKKEEQLNECINNLKFENQLNKNEINSLSKQNNVLKKKQEEEDNNKRLQKENINKFKREFEKDKQNIKINKINESKKKINNVIINKYVKEFQEKKGKKSNITNSLINFMKGFTKDFMKFSENFIESFKKKSSQIIEEYDVKKNKILIEHINFIVIGSAGVGKSTFINESLLLEDQKAEEGKGESITKKSKLYTSDKLKMVRMWDTPGIDFKISQDIILKEIERLVNQGLEKGPDHFINIILYCIKGDRFQEEEGKIIYNIMQLYPSDNLPVIITQLQSYFEEDTKEMNDKIRNILYKYLDKNIVDKIEIRDIISRNKKIKDSNMIIKARGIPELLKSSCDIIGRAITSATFKKFSEDIGKLCKEYVDNKIDYINIVFNDENELLENSYILANEEEEDNYLDNNKKPAKKNILSLENKYKNTKDKLYFAKNFISILNNKMIEIYNNLNNISQFSNEKPAIAYLIEEKLTMIKGILETLSQKAFNAIFEEYFHGYYNELQLQHSSRNKEFETNVQIYDAKEIKEDFRKELLDFYNNEFFKIFICIIINLFKNNLKQILVEQYQQYLKENEKIINQKAEIALKNVTSNLKQKIVIEVDKYFPAQSISRIETESNECSSNRSLEYDLNKINNEIIFPNY